MNKNFSNTYMISNSVTIITSKLATYKYIRKYLVNKQRLFRQPPGLVANGRDMGTVVFSYAIIKFFLEATLTNRVHRRLQEFKKKKYN
ncbi:(d)CMP kinase, partial [Buchnera aphidicola]|uniref:(d)CMP kinase n=1 Tax=Buchnera aphidicola TaxID=9 RepID=UPI0022376020|nr:(d)CMP kinase [Buchnera aphidicola (Stegophylla sp.)]